jgi:hypothetical protein
VAVAAVAAVAAAVAVVVAWRHGGKQQELTSEKKVRAVVGFRQPPNPGVYPWPAGKGSVPLMIPTAAHESQPPHGSGQFEAGTAPTAARVIK